MKKLSKEKIAAYRSKLYELIANNIVTYGRHCQGVFPTEKDPGPSFIYTIGNQEKGLPELLLIGNHEVSDVMNQMSRMMVKRGRAFDDGEIVDLGGDCPVKVINASVEAKQAWTIQAGRFYRNEDYDVQQVIMPDTKGRFPPDCDPPYNSVPILRRLSS